MSTVSVLVITLNEEKNIRECLQSVSWADEIVLVDAQSQDRTVEIAGEFTDRVFVRPWAGFAATRQYALSQCRQEWVLWLDADERATPELAREIREVIRDTAHAGFEIPRLAWFLGRWIRHGGWYPGYVLRLFRRQGAEFTDRMVHEGVVVKGSTGKLKNHLLHYTDPNIEHYFQKFNLYTGLAARELHEKGVPFRLRDLIFRPLFMFIKMYLLRRGFLDGLQGFLLACFSSAYVFAKYAKLWELTYGEMHHSKPI